MPKQRRATSVGADVTAPEQLEELCLSCGLCCDGTLFGVVPLARDEVQLAERASLPIHRDEAKVGLKQPCGALVEGCCTIYAHRPKRCLSYRCQVLKRFASGESTNEATQLLIARAKREIRKIREKGARPEWTVWDAGDHFLAETRNDRARTEVAVAMVALATLLFEEFDRDAAGSSQAVELTL